MADQGDSGDEGVNALGYKIPVKKTLEEIQKMDEADESLKRYKEALLGNLAKGEEVPFPNNPNNAVIDSFIVCVEGQPEKSICLMGDLEKACATPIVIPEGSTYRIKVKYHIQRDIVSGLQYFQSTYRGPVRVDHSTVMLGSYGPQKDTREWTSEEFEAPKGAMHRGSYSIKSSFKDIDKKEYIHWKWTINVVKASSS